MFGKPLRKLVFVLVALAKVRDFANELKFRVFFLPALVQPILAAL